MQLGIFAKTFSGRGPRQILDKAAAAGYATVQYNMSCSGLASLPDEIPDDTIAELDHARASSGVGLCALSATYNMAHPDRAVRLRGLRHLDILADAAKRLGIPVLTLCTGTRNAADQWAPHPGNGSRAAWLDMLENMEAAVLIAERHDVHLGVEPELANIVSSAAHAASLIDELRTDRIGIVLDAANLFETASADDRRAIVEAAIETLGAHIAIAHAKDRTSTGAFTAAGHGVLDYRHYLDCLRAAGFDGPLVTHGLEESEAPEVARFLGRCGL